MPPHPFLNEAPINLHAIQEVGREELMKILDNIPDSKHLVVDPRILDIFDHIDGASFFKDRNVLSIHSFHKPLNFIFNQQDIEETHIVFFIRPVVPQVGLVAQKISEQQQQISQYRQKFSRVEFHIIFVPHRSTVCDRILVDEQLNKHDNVKINFCRLTFVPFDSDLLSLELDYVLRDLYVHGDTSCLQIITNSLYELLVMFGTSPIIQARGKFAGQVQQKIDKLMSNARKMGNSDNSLNSGREIEPQIAAMILIDRDCDFITPLVTPLTYEGLIDEIIGIENGYISLDSEIINEENKGEEKVKIQLNSSNRLYAQIRDRNIETIGSFLGQRAKEIQMSHEAFRKNKDATIGEIHDFVKRIPGLNSEFNSLNQHINIVEIINKNTTAFEFRTNWQIERGMLEGETNYDYIEDLIATNEPLPKVLRLLCLQSLTNGGLKSSKYDHLRREIVQSYGFEIMLTLNNLEKVGLIKRREMSLLDSGSPWTNISRNLGLINDAIDVCNPRDISFVSSGYAPLSVKISEVIAHSAGLPIPESRKNLIGPVTTLNLGTMNTGMEGKQDQNSQLMQNAPNKKLLLLFYIGGVTFMEIAALRFLSKSDDFPYRIMIATTGFINGKKFLKSFSHGLDYHLVR